MRLRRQVKLGLIGVAGSVVVILVILLWDPVRALLTLLPDPKVMLKYNASNEKNLQALRTALLKYHESEGQFPKSDGWMDAIKNRIKDDNMTQEESERKFVNPLYKAKNGLFGYGFNDAASDKYKGDLKPGTVLVFDSTDTKWDAHGDPAKLKPPKPYPGGQEGITVEGKIVKL